MDALDHIMLLKRYLITVMCIIFTPIAIDVTGLLELVP